MIVHSQFVNKISKTKKEGNSYQNISFAEQEGGLKKRKYFSRAHINFEVLNTQNKFIGK